MHSSSPNPDEFVTESPRSDIQTPAGAPPDTVRIACWPTDPAVRKRIQYMLKRVKRTGNKELEGVLAAVGSNFTVLGFLDDRGQLVDGSGQVIAPRAPAGSLVSFARRVPPQDASPAC